MQAASMRRPGAPQDRIQTFDWGAAWTWLLGFGLVAYLGLEGGGYDPLVHDRVGVAVWWVLIVAVGVGALPRGRPGRWAWIAAGLLAAFVVWTALSLGWTESVDRTSADLARLAGYLGLFVLAVFSWAPREARRVVSAVAMAIALVSIVGLLSRLHPGWFPNATQTANFATDKERLSYPINYWNGLAGLIAIGLPLMLQVAFGARKAIARGLAAASLPAMTLTLYLTLSRGGIAAAALALGIFFALAPDRLPKLLTLAVATVGSAVLIAAVNSRDALQHGLLDDAARREGSEMLWIVLGVCLVVGLAQVGLSAPRAARARPGWTRVSRRNSLIVTVVGALVLFVLALAVGAPGRISDGWQEFKQGGGPGAGAGRLGSVAGQSRYQLWGAAVRENETKPLIGTGSGTFEFWWTRNGDTDETVRDTHSLYLQTLGELGIIGLVLIVGFLAVVALGAALAIRGAPPSARARLAAASAGFAAFCITAMFDWMWQIPALAAAMLLLASVLVVEAGRAERPPGKGPPDKGDSRFSAPSRVLIGALGLAAIAAIAVPLASTTFVRESEADARKGDLGGALAKARTAQNAQPGAAGPRLQQALVLEEMGRFAAAAAAADAATERERTNWRNWLVLSRIEAERGRPEAAIAAYRRARALDPRSEIFSR